MLKYHIMGDSAVNIVFSREISSQVGLKILSLYKALQENTIPGIKGIIPAYTTISVFFDPLIISFSELIDRIDIFVKQEQNFITKAKIIEIPVLYSKEYGEDIDRVLEHTGYTLAELIKEHTTPLYLVHMIGFMPGFPYLGGLSAKLVTPRLATPRLRIPVGSVAIGGGQTGIYPLESPGGWNIIGRTPVAIYTPKEESPTLLYAGDYVKFVAVDEKEYFTIENNKHYQVKSYEK